MDYKEFLSRYQFNPNEPLGEGGFAKVFKAFDKQTKTYVAVKQGQVSPSMKYSLLREVENAKTLQHPNLVRYEAGYRFQTPQGTFDYAVMELVNGTSLDLYLEASPTDVQLVNMLTGILRGLRYLHERHIVHRDLKAANILINYENGQQVPKIIDFGISKDVGKEEQTVSSQMVGTCAYMAPEQLFILPEPQNISSAATDFWAFGVVLYRMQLGSLPFGADFMEVRDRILKGLDTAKLRDIPDNYRRIIERCLVTDPAARCQSADELLELLNSQTVQIGNDLKKAKTLFAEHHYSAAFRLMFDMQSCLYMDPEAMFLYAKMYEDGSAIPKNIEAAKDYYRQASELGYAPAKEALNRLSGGKKQASGEETVVISRGGEATQVFQKAPVQKQVPSEGKSNKGLFIGIGVAALLAVAALAFYFMNGKGDQEAEVAKFMKDLRTGLAAKTNETDSLEWYMTQFEKAYGTTDLHKSLKPDSINPHIDAAYAICKNKEEKIVNILLYGAHVSLNMSETPEEKTDAENSIKKQEAARDEVRGKRDKIKSWTHRDPSQALMPVLEEMPKSESEEQPEGNTLTTPPAPENQPNDAQKRAQEEAARKQKQLEEAKRKEEELRKKQAANASLSFEQGNSGQWGLVNDNGDLVVPYQFEKMKDFRGNIAAVRKNGSWGFIARNGRMLTNLVYDAVDVLSGATCGDLKFSAVRNGTKYYISSNGAENATRPDGCKQPGEK